PPPSPAPAHGWTSRGPRTAESPCAGTPPRPAAAGREGRRIQLDRSCWLRLGLAPKRLPTVMGPRPEGCKRNLSRKRNRPGKGRVFKGLGLNGGRVEHGRADHGSAP